MKFSRELIHETLIKRYKRFLTDVRLDNGEEVIAHCTNSGSMKSCLEDGAEVYKAGVEIIPLQIIITPQGIEIDKVITFQL